MSAIALDAASKVALREAQEDASDFSLPFVIDQSRLRGRLVRLPSLVDDLLRRHDYHAVVERQLAELLAATAAVAPVLKAEARLTVQLKGDGPLSLLFADRDPNGGLRALANLDRDRLARLEARRGAQALDLAALLGQGHMALTLITREKPYQAITPLAEPSLAAALTAHFRQSAQLEIGLRLAAERDASGRWQAAAILLERLPELGGKAAPETSYSRAETRLTPDAASQARLAARDAEAERWQRNLAFLHSVEDQELLDPELSAEALLYRLFHHDGVRTAKPQALSRVCRCSIERIKTVLMSLSRKDLADCFNDDGQIESVCEFCGTVYRLSAADLATV